MSAFTHGFNHGFFHGMFNGMFGGFGAFNWGCWNFRPSFFTSSFSFGNFFNYQSPMPMAPSVFSYNVPNFSAVNANIGLQNCNYAVPANMNMNWQTLNYSTPQFQYGFNGLGDSFIRTENPPKKPRTDTPTPGSTNELKGKHWSEMTDAQLRQVYGNYTRDITKPYTGTAEDLNRYLDDKGVLKNKGQAFIDAQNKYGVSASVLVAICMNESAKGASNLARNKNNVGGVRISGSTEFRNFTSVEECIDYMGSFLNSGYINNSGRPLKQLYQINAKYCPASDPTDRSGLNSRWAKAVEMYASQVENALA